MKHVTTALAVLMFLFFTGLANAEAIKGFSFMSLDGKMYSAKELAGSPLVINV